MINVELDKQHRFSLTFFQAIKTIPGYGQRTVVECEVWTDTNVLVVIGRAVLNPLDQDNPAIGCRKALAAAIKDLFTSEDRKEFFEQLEGFFQQLQPKPKRPAGFNRTDNE